MKKKTEQELPTAELLERLDAEKIRFAKMKINHAVSPLENPNEIKNLRREIARMKTELRDRELKNAPRDRK